MKQLGKVCASLCCFQNEAELKRLSSQLAVEKDKREKAEKMAAELRAKIHDCNIKFEATQSMESKVCDELKEQIEEAAQRSGQLLDEEQQLLKNVEDATRSELGKIRAECQDQLTSLEDRLQDLLKQQQARTMELQASSEGKTNGKDNADRVSELEEANANLQAQLDEQQRKLQEAKALRQPLEDQSARRKGQRDTLSREVADIEDATRANPILKENNAALSARICELEGQVEDITELTDHLSHHKQVYNDAESEVKRLRAEELRVSQELAAHQAEAANLELALESARCRAGVIDASEEELQTRVNEVEDEARCLKEELRSVHDEIATTTREVEEQKEAHLRVSVLAATNRDLRATQSVIRQQQAEIEALRSEVEFKRERIKQQADLKKQRLAERKKMEETKARVEARNQKATGRIYAASSAARAAAVGPVAKASATAAAKVSVRASKLAEHSPASSSPQSPKKP